MMRPENEPRTDIYFYVGGQGIQEIGSYVFDKDTFDRLKSDIEEAAQKGRPRVGSYPAKRVLDPESESLTLVLRVDLIAALA